LIAVLEKNQAEGYPRQGLGILKSIVVYVSIYIKIYIFLFIDKFICFIFIKRN